jgi:UPF0755 protein
MAPLKRQSPTRQRSNRKGAGILRALWLTASAGLLCLAIAFGWFIYEADRPILGERGLGAGQPEAAGKSQVQGLELLIPYGISARQVAAMLRAEGLDIHEGMFLLHARWLDVHRNLRAGVYAFEPGTTKRQLLLRLAGKDPDYIEFRILEGWSVRQALGAAAKESELIYDLSQHRTSHGLAQALGAPTTQLEGWLYPDLYVVARKSQVSTLLQRAVRLQQRMLAKEWAQRSADLPLQSPYEALILASIVEKETQYPGDRERVAAVFTNRLKLGMKLQADPTVIYGLGDKFQGDITRLHLKTDTPYNTYTRKSLPPTPISNPGLAALKAVMNPAQTRDIFFVARGDGSSEFSETYAQHNAAVDRFIRRLQAADTTQAGVKK